MVRVAATIDFHDAELPASFRREDRHLIGVSGGRDSVALFHWLLGHGFRNLVVCHLDHHLRETSADDARFVQDLAEQQGCVFQTKTVDVRAWAHREKQSLENAARELRYRFFAEAANAYDCPRLFLAHHADDQVETFLLQLLRGAGPGGLGGMAPFGERIVDGRPLTVARPLLGVWRAEIDAYLTAQRLTFVEDASNQETRFTRNRVRHQAIPTLEQAFQRDIRRSLWRAAEILRAENQCLAKHPLLDHIPAQLPVAMLDAQPLALQRRIVQKWLRTSGVPDVGFDEIEAVLSLSNVEIAKVNLPGDWCARRRVQTIFLDRQGTPPSARSTTD